MASFTVLRTMSYLPRATIRNLNIVHKSSTTLLGVPLHTTRLSPITRISTIGIRHSHETSFVKKSLEIKKEDNYLGLNATFFNRVNELQSLSCRLATQPPTLTIILGPPSSGKTALVRKVVNTTPNLKPIFIDLRIGTFDTVENTVNSLRRQFDSYFDYLKSALKSLNASLPGVSEVSSIAGLKLDPESPPKVQFADLLEEIDSRLPTWSAFDDHNVPRPVLIVDEANRFMNLVHTEEKATVETFLQWLVVNTKQSLRFHVVLTSSDPNFQSWLEQRLTHFETMVVGDLTKSEAERFFHDHVLTEPRFKFAKQDLSDKFDQVFKMTGGRMLYIVDYLNQYERAKMIGRDFKDDEMYSTYLQAYALLRKALYPTELSESYPERAPARFSRAQFINLMRLFVESSGGFILEEDAKEKFGKPAIRSFIEYNIVHPRPPGNNNPDVLGSPKRLPILLPMGRPHLRAMQDLLKDLEERIESRK